MAKVKKKLSLEELLEEALVKEEDRPYELPQNWVWTKIGSISEFERGITFPASAKEHAYDEKLIACIRTANIQENLETDDLIYVDKSFIKNNKSKLLKKDDILMSSANSRELVGKVSYVNNISNEMTFGGFVLNIRALRIDSKFLFYFLRYEFLSGKFMGESTQTTNIANINSTILGSYTCPLPPLGEQRGIVKVIESLFEKLDMAKELVQNSLDTFECRKAAILHKAFSGELTAKWREENGVNLESWEEKKLGKLIKSGPQNGLYKPQTAYGQGCMIVRIDNFYEGTINPWHTLKRLSLEESEKEIYGLKNNDIIINRVNSIQYLGKSALVRNLDESCVFESNVMRFTLTEDIATEYAIRYLNSDLGLTELRKNAKHAVNQASINQTDVKNAIIRVPTTEEQKEIVCILDKLLENEQRAKELSNVIEKIDLMKKAILARAFRGELGTNHPEEENAIELLKEVLKEKI